MSEFIESTQLSIEDVEKIGMEGQTQARLSILDFTHAEKKKKKKLGRNKKKGGS